jgi:hypothetical protein
MNLRISPLGKAGLFIVLGVNVSLLATIATEVDSDGQKEVDSARWNPSLSLSSANATARRPIESYKEIVARPLFFKSREPFVPPPPPPPQSLTPTSPTPVSDPGLILGGIMINNNVRKAFVASKSGSSGSWAQEGDEFMGWQIRSIDRLGAKLEQKGRSIDLRLYPQD